MWAALSLSVLIFYLQCCSAKEDQPNFIIMNMDDLGWGTLGWWAIHQEKLKTLIVWQLRAFCLPSFIPAQQSALLLDPPCWQVAFHCAMVSTKAHTQGGMPTPLRILWVVFKMKRFLSQKFWARLDTEASWLENGILGTRNNSFLSSMVFR